MRSTTEHMQVWLSSALLVATAPVALATSREGEREQRCAFVLVEKTGGPALAPLVVSRVDLAASLYRLAEGPWRALGPRCASGVSRQAGSVDRVSRCELQTPCGPHQFRLAIEEMLAANPTASRRWTTPWPKAGALAITQGGELRYTHDAASRFTRGGPATRRAPR